MRDLKSPSNLSKQKKTFHYSVDISSLGGGEYYMMKETLLCPTFDTLNSWHFEDCNVKKGASMIMSLTHLACQKLRS